MSLYEGLSEEGKILLKEAMEHLREGYNPDTHLVTANEQGQRFISIRNSMYYALGLMILDENWDTIKSISNAVMALQMDAPGEVFHGAFRHEPEEPLPPARQLNAEKLGLYGRYYGDISWEEIMARFSQALLHDSVLAKEAVRIEEMLRSSLSQTIPVAWLTYEPNTREFILMCLAMLLEHGESRMDSGWADAIDHSARLAMEGAIQRSESNFTPLNTNIQCMHIFLLDYFGRRFREASWLERAVSYAKGVLYRYREFHACAEFNSPTYCGVDLSTLGFVRRYSKNPALIEITDELEAGIWRDAGEFYNPAMRNFCGPYSRAYELDMSIHTCFCDLLFLGLGQKSFPWHPFSIESPCNPLLLLGDVRIPLDAKEAFLTPKPDQVITHQFRELSERGDPENNSALCTATAWITPNLMTGALSGSENPSYQLHPLVIFWKTESGLGTVKLLRCLPDGRMTHLHTVLFNGRADRNRLSMDVQSRVHRDVDVFFEIECDDMEKAILAPDFWQLPGLNLILSAKAPAPRVEKVNARILRVIYPARMDQPESLQMHFDLQALLPSEA